MSARVQTRPLSPEQTPTPASPRPPAPARRSEGGGLGRRSIELLLLLAAAPVIILLFSLALMNDGKPFSLEDLAVPLGLFAAFLVSHLVVRWLAPGADPVLLPLSFALSGIGIAFVMRLAPAMAGRQVIWLFVGIACMVGTLLLVRSVQRLGDFKYTIIILGIIALLLPIFIGTEINGSKIWLRFAGFSFQPGELAKILVVLFLAGYLADNREMLSVSGRRVGRLLIPDLRTLAPLIIMWALSLVIVVFERDLGSALLFFGLFVIMVYIATGRITYVVISVLLGAVGAVAAFLVFAHVQARVEIWLDPFADPQNAGYQLVQALYSLADGDIIGTGIGRGMPDLIPLVESDFIFVAMAEEMGLLGASAVLLLFVLFAVRGLTVASRAKSDMEAFTATGLTAAISLQAFVIVGGVTALIPLTGVTLPFISQGGSSLVASFIIVGLLLRIGDGATGHEKELQSTSSLGGGVLGRYALGKRLTLLVTLFSVAFALLIANLAWQMIVRAPELRALPSNNHQIAREQYAQRGAILTSDGVVLARSVRQESGGYERVYPEGSLAAHLIGYSSSRFGLSGVEASQQEMLRGEMGFSTWTDAINSIAGVPIPGNDVQLSTDSRIQRAAEKALVGYSGAAVVLDAQSGAVLAQASSPTYDINDVESLLKETGDASGSDSHGGILVNRATQGLYPPGSTFKLVTLTGALSRGGIRLSDNFNAPGTLEIGGATVTNFQNTSYGEITVKRALEVSSNTVFAQIANLLGPQTLVQTANEFGFGQKLGQDFDTSASLMPDPDDMTEWETAWAGAGEPVGEHRGSPAGPQATVTQMALVAAAFANDGVIMKPYVVASTVSPDGKTLTRATPIPLNTIASADVVAQVNEAMAGVVSEGFGYEAQIPGYTVYGKTGTAETNNEMADSWFIGHLEVSGRRIAIALALEQSGGGVATPRAREVLEEAISVYR